MKHILAFLYFGILMASLAQASSDSVRTGPAPVLQRTSPTLQRSLRTLRTQVERDARECMENARGMDASGSYGAVLNKALETSKAVVIVVSGSMMCGTSSYQYAIALEATSGKRLDLNSIYNIGVRQDDHVFLRPELADSATESYRQANANNKSCFEGTGWQDGLTNFPITFSTQSDAGIALYYATPDVSAACFPTLKVSQRNVAPYRDAKRAAEYALP